jgi:cysteine desulfurase
MIYLDHNASSPLRDCARSAMLEALGETGNASSVHTTGRRARARVEKARAQVAKLCGALPEEVVFTASGSEANALALKGAVLGSLAEGKPIARILYSAVEHESVRANASAIAGQVPGIVLRELPVTKDGVADLSALRLALREGVGRVLISVMAANNETGVVQDIGEIARIAKEEAGKDALIHADAVPAIGKMPLAFDAVEIDYVTLSSHKLGGPQGVGALLVKEAAPLVPLIAGGGQEMRKRAGTENVAGIAGFGAAVEETAAASGERARMERLRDVFERELLGVAPHAIIFGKNTKRLANTSCFAIAGLSAEAALIGLDIDGIAVSSGSACSSGKVKSSHVLSAMGVPVELARSALRVSFGWNSADDDVAAIIRSLHALVNRRACIAA